MVVLSSYIITNRHESSGEIDMNDKKKVSVEFKDRLRIAREKRQLGQGDLAKRAGGLPPSSISHFEAGTRKPSFDNLKKLAGALDVTTDYLLGRAESMDGTETADPLYRNIENLTADNRDIASKMIEMLAEKSMQKDKD